MVYLLVITTIYGIIGTASLRSWGPRFREGTGIFFLAYVIPSDLQSGFVPQIRFATFTEDPLRELEHFLEGMAEGDEEFEAYKGLLRGGGFTNEAVEIALGILWLGITNVSIAAGAVVIGTVAQLIKIGAKNPWLAKPISGYLGRVFKPIAVSGSKRGGWRFASNKLGRLSSARAVKSNPVYKSVVRSGAMATKAMSLKNRLMLLDRMDLDVDVDLQELEKFLEREQDFKSRGPATGEDDMPYNRRTGQWYPARRRGGYSRGGGGYSRGGYSRGRSSSYAPRRRRSYRRW